jgi:Sigma-70, region 4
MKPLRAFLFSRSFDGVWSATVYRELEPLESAIKFGPNSEKTCYFLHVGFWRPETSELEQLGESWNARVLMSHSAIHAMPTAPMVSIGSVAKISSLPVFVCLSGYGYEIPDPTVSTELDQASPTYQDEKAEQFDQATGHSRQLRSASALLEHHKSGEAINWVEWTAIQRQDLEQVLRSASITNDKDYLEKERSISSREVRHELAMIRYGILVGNAPEAENFLDKLHATPYWFLDLPLTRFRLTVRQNNVFVTNDLKTVQDLGLLGTLGLLKLQNMGRKSVFDLSQVLIDAFKDGVGLISYDTTTPGPLSKSSTQDADSVKNDSMNQPIISPEIFESFSVGISSAVKHISIEDRGVWAARIGYKCQPQTLQKIAGTVGVTRERIRQIEQKVIRQVAKSPLLGQLEKRLKDLLKDRESPLLVGGLFAYDPWFDPDIDFEHPLKNICKTLLNKRLSVFNVRDVAVVTEITQSEWEDAVGNAKTALEAMIGAAATESHARSIIDGLLPNNGKELRNDLWHEVNLDAKWSVNNSGDRTLVGFGSDIETVMLTILNASETPLHTSEITRRIRSYGIANHDEHYIRNTAQKVAMLFDRGTYGLSKHITLSEDQLAIIPSEVESIIAEGEPTRQWHTSELFSLLQDRGLDFDGELTKYLINIALKESSELSYLRRMVWGQSDHWSNNSNERLDVRQAVIALLESNGKPMSISNIRARLSQDRGLSTHFQIFSISPIIRIGPSVFGLDYRDVNYEKIHPLVDKLKSVLRSRNTGLHISEVPMAIGLIGDDVDTEAATVVMVGTRHGLKQDKAQYVFPEEWQTSRRYSIPSAFQQAVEEANKNGMSSQLILKRVCELTQRQISQNSISHMLRDQGFMWDEASGLWFEDFDPEEED